MNVRKFLLCAAAMSAMASTVTLQAQDEKKKGGRGGGMPTVEQRMERLEQAVGSLSEQQKTKIKAIYAKSAEKLQGLSQEERRDKGMEIFQAAAKEVRAVLTPEQQQKFDAMPQGGGRSGGGSSGGKKKDQ